MTMQTKYNQYEKAATNGDGFSFWGLKKRGRKEDSQKEAGMEPAPGKTAVHGFRYLSWV